MKIATTAAAAEVIAREARPLVEFRARPLPQVDQTLPRHLGTFHADGMLASVSPWCRQCRCAPLHEFRHPAQPRSVRRDFAAARTG